MSASAPVADSCPSCGGGLPGGARYCPECGVSVEDPVGTTLRVEVPPEETGPVPVAFSQAEPRWFGLTPPLFLQLLDAAWSDRVAGVLLSEFDPGRDRQDQGLALLVWLLEYLLLRRYEG